MCFGNVSLMNRGDKDSSNVDVVSKGDATLNIHDDAHIIAYICKHVKFRLD
jgi:hypothetical protein